MEGEQGVGPGPAGGLLQGCCVGPAPRGAAQPNAAVPAPTGVLLAQVMAPGGSSMGFCCHPAQGLPKQSQTPLARTGSSLTLRTRRAGLCCPGWAGGSSRGQGYTMTGLSVPRARSNPPAAGGWMGPCSSWGAKPLRDGLLSAQVECGRNCSGYGGVWGGLACSVHPCGQSQTRGCSSCPMGHAACCGWGTLQGRGCWGLPGERGVSSYC